MAKQKSMQRELRQLDRAAAVIAAIKLAHDEGSGEIDLGDLAHIAHGIVLSVRDRLEKR